MLRTALVVSVVVGRPVSVAGISVAVSTISVVGIAAAVVAAVVVGLWLSLSLALVQLVEAVRGQRGADVLVAGGHWSTVEDWVVGVADWPDQTVEPWFSLGLSLSLALVQLVDTVGG